MSDTAPTSAPSTLAARLDDLLLAPGASGAEAALGYGAALFGAVMGATLGMMSGFDPFRTLVLAVLAFDLFGGAVVNATPAAERRFHHPRHWLRRMIGFVAAHVHLLVVALLFPGYSWVAASCLYLGLVGSAVAVTLTGDRLRRPVAFACAAVLSTASLTVLLPAAALVWIAPLLVIKLILGHLLRGGHQPA